jgi:glycosyltransferase involved in cell wall biosynthesis
MSDVRLSVILPGYNESHAVAAAVGRYVAALEGGGMSDFELVVVDDGSTDGMGELADRLADRHARVRVIHMERNSGQVACILRGFREARGRVLTHNGMDLPFDPGDTPAAMAAIDGGADVVVVQRRTRESYGMVRKIVSWTNVLLVRLLFGSRFRDHNFVQFFRREVVESVPVLSNGVSTVTVELIVRAVRMGYAGVAIDAEYHQRTTGKSTVTLRKVGHAFLQVMHLWRLMRRGGRRRRSRTNAGGVS